MKKQEKQLLFTITIKDCEVQTFCAGGKGGQHQNRTETGVRIIHPPSGARGEARDSRDQLLNKRSAFLRMASTKEFQTWHKMETSRRLGKPIPKSMEQIEKEIDEVIEKVQIFLDTNDMKEIHVNNFIIERVKLEQ
jgi:protein subunit release factor B